MGRPRKQLRKIGAYLPCGPEALERAYRRQRELAAAGSPRRLGEVLLEMGAVTQEDLTRALHAQRFDRFRTSPVFTGLSEQELQEISFLVGEERLGAGQVLIRQGEVGDCFYVVIDGQALVYWREEAGEELPLATLGPGESIGEMGYFSDGLRSASVKALTDLEVLRISYEDLDRTLNLAPTLSRNFSDIVTRRLRRVNLRFQESVLEVQETKTSLEQLQSLVDMSEVLSLRMDIEGIIDQMVRMSSKVMNAERASLLLVDWENKELWSKVAEGEEHREIRIPLQSGIAGWVIEHDQVLAVEDAYQDRRFNPDVDRRTGFKTRSVLCGPVKNSQGKIIGVIQVINKHKGVFDEDDRALFKTLTRQTSIALENFRLYEGILGSHEKMASLLDVNRDRTRELDTDGLLNAIMNRISGILEDINQEKMVRNTLLRYMDHEVVENILSDPEKQVLGGMSVKATALFSDIQGFVGMAHRMSAEEAVAFLNHYFGRMVDLVLEAGGVLDKFIGDALMAVFGVPSPREDDAVRAVGAALAMRRAVGAINRERRQTGQEPIGVGIGISTGNVIAGNIGSEKRMDFTVVGDAVNVAARLERLTRTYGRSVLISEAAFQEIGDHFVTRPIDRVLIRGHVRPTQVIEVLGARGYRLTEGEECFARGWRAYLEGDFAAALDCFDRGAETDPACRTFAGRCRGFLQDPPGGKWDGVWLFEERVLVRP